jgi:hypothetical protein
VFWSGSGGSVDKIAADKDCVVFYQTKNGAFTLALSDPTFASATIRITVNEKLTPTSLPAGVTAQVVGSKTEVTFNVSQGRTYLARFSGGGGGGGGVTASAFQAPNAPENTVDGDLGTRWSAEGDGQWIQYDLGSAQPIDTVKVAWYRGDQRTATFDVKVSSDGASFTTVLAGAQTSGTTAGLQTHAFTPVNARYIRIVGHGSSENAWNSITEVALGDTSNRSIFGGSLGGPREDGDLLVGGCSYLAHRAVVPALGAWILPCLLLGCGLWLSRRRAMIARLAGVVLCGGILLACPGEAPRRRGDSGAPNNPYPPPTTDTLAADLPDLTVDTGLDDGIAVDGPAVSDAGPDAGPGGFDDVPSTHPRATEIQWVAQKGIMTGCAASKFCPDATLTRAAAAVTIIRMKYGDSFNYTTTPHFADVPTSHWAFKFVQKLKDDGVTDGCGSGDFCPDMAVQRDAGATLLMRAKHGSSFNYTTTPHFNDVPASHWAFEFVQKLKDDGATSGCGSGNFCPEMAVTRSMWAIFLYRLQTL